MLNILIFLKIIYRYGLLMIVSPAPLCVSYCKLVIAIWVDYKKISFIFDIKPEPSLSGALLIEH